MSWMGTDFKSTAGDLVVDGTGDAAVVSSLECLAQDLAARLATPKGSLPWAPNFGTDARQFLRSEGTDLNQRALRQAVATELETDPRVVAGTATVTVLSWSNDQISLQCSVLPVGQTNPLILVVSVSA